MLDQDFNYYLLIFFPFFLNKRLATTLYMHGSILAIGAMIGSIVSGSIAKKVGQRYVSKIFLLIGILINNFE